MQKLQTIDLAQAGNSPRIIGEPAPTNSNDESLKLTPRQMAAARAAVRLFDLMGPQDVGDPAALQSAIAATFAGYPQDVIDKAPVAIAQRSDRLSLKLVTAVCDEIYEPIERQLERDRAAQSHRLGLPPPPTKRTPEQQARVDEQVASARRQLGIPDRDYFPASKEDTTGPPGDEHAA